MNMQKISSRLLTFSSTKNCLSTKQTRIAKQLLGKCKKEYFHTIQPQGLLYIGRQVEYLIYQALLTYASKDKEIQ